MSTINPNSVPVAPEFVESLQETVAATLEQCLSALNVPESVVVLVDDLVCLAYYTRLFHEDPQSLIGDNPEFDGASVVIKAINHLAAAGAVFPGPYMSSVQRPGTFLNKTEKAASEKVKVA